MCWCWCVGVNFDALATGEWYRIERKPVVFLCWMQDSNPGFLEPNVQQTECPLTNHIKLSRIKLKNLLKDPSLWSASIKPTRPHCRYGFPLALAIYIFWFMHGFCLPYSTKIWCSFIHLLINLFIHLLVLFSATIYMNCVVRLSIRLSVCQSVTPWSQCYRDIEFSGVITVDRSYIHAKRQGHRSQLVVITWCTTSYDI